MPIPGRPPSLINLPSCCSFHPRCPYVRERHTREDPRLEPVNGDRGHAVACLLSRETRGRLWRELRESMDPAAARREIGLETLRDD